MSLNYVASTKAGQGALITLSTALNLSGYTISVETSTTSNFATPSTAYGVASYQGDSVQITLSASDVDTLQDSFFRVKLTNGGNTYYLATGQLSYSPSASSSITSDMVDAQGNIKQSYIDSPALDTTVSNFILEGGSAVSTALKSAIDNEGAAKGWNANSISDATASAKGIVQLTGDLGGTATNPQVTSGANHTHSSGQISDATTVGKSLVTAADAATARSAIGAGTSSLTLGTTASTALAGNYTPPNATSGAAGVIQLAGDLAGTASSPTVAKINGATPATVATSGAYTDLSGLPALGTSPQGTQTDVASRFTVDENRISTLENAGAPTAGVEVASMQLTTTYGITAQTSPTTFTDTGLSIAVPAQTRGYYVELAGQFYVITNSSFVATKGIIGMLRIVDSGVTEVLDDGIFPFTLINSGSNSTGYRFFIRGRVSPGAAAITWKVQARVGQTLDANITGFGLYGGPALPAPAAGVTASPVLFTAVTY